jgi:hypothetical protein
LNSQELRNSTSDQGIPGQMMREGFMTELQIPRADTLQDLAVSASFNTKGDLRGIGGDNNLAYHVADRKPLEPLTKWMKQFTDKGGLEKKWRGPPTNARLSSRRQPARPTPDSLQTFSIRRGRSAIYMR